MWRHMLTTEVTPGLGIQRINQLKVIFSREETIPRGEPGQPADSLLLRQFVEIQQITKQQIAKQTSHF